MIINKLDSYVSKKARLTMKKQEIIDKTNKKNSDLEAKIEKLETKIKSLRDLTFRNVDKKMLKLSEIDRQVKKLTKLINIEVDYAKELGNMQKEIK